MDATPHTPLTAIGRNDSPAGDTATRCAQQGSSTLPSYVLITPARNEAQYIKLTLDSMVAQTVPPLKWVIVSDGSTDGTDEVVKGYSAKHPWIELVRMPERAERHFAGKVGAFNAGLARVKDAPYQIIGNLDADISFDDDFFAFLLAKFRENPELGVGGTPFIESGRQYDYRFTSIEHVSGQCQLFRRECFEDIGGYIPRKLGGIDLVAVLTAQMKGWQTRTFLGKTYTHHRKMGTGMYGELTFVFKGGQVDYMLGSHPLWEICRCLYQMKNKPFLLLGLLRLIGFFWAMLRRARMDVPPELMQFRRKSQMQRLYDFLKHLVFMGEGSVRESTADATNAKCTGSGEEATSNGRERANKVVVEGKSLFLTGKFIKRAEVEDDVWLEGQAVPDPESFLAKLRTRAPNVDIFSFVQKLPDTQPKYSYPYEWDNVAAIPITTYSEWFEKRLPQVARKNLRRSVKRGVVSRVTQYDDALVRGIMEIHNDTPIRQGVPFTHYGKGFAAVKDGYGSYLDRSEFIGAYLGDELIGIIKLIYMGNNAGILNLLAKTAHYDKRPTSSLIAKAVEICEKKGMSYLVYGKFTYGNKVQSTLTEFKARNGFEKIEVPRYYIPLTITGRIAMAFRLHLTLIEILPGSVITILRALRAKYTQAYLSLKGISEKTQKDVSVEAED